MSEVFETTDQAIASACLHKWVYQELSRITGEGLVAVLGNKLVDQAKRDYDNALLPAIEVPANLLGPWAYSPGLSPTTYSKCPLFVRLPQDLVDRAWG